VFGQEILQSIPAEGRALGVGEDNLRGLTVALWQPLAQSGDRVFAQWRATLFAAFAQAPNVGTRS
jgi:hypothetical protein